MPCHAPLGGEPDRVWTPTSRFCLRAKATQPWAVVTHGPLFSFVVRVSQRPGRENGGPEGGCVHAEWRPGLRCPLLCHWHGRWEQWWRRGAGAGLTGTVRTEQGPMAREGAGAEARHDGAGAARARHVVVRAEQGWRRVMGGAKA